MKHTTQIHPFQPQPQKSHSRVSVGSVLKARFCRWLDNATMKDFRRVLRRGFHCFCMMFVAFAVAAPSYAMGIAIDTLKWNQFRVLVPKQATLGVAHARWIRAAAIVRSRLAGREIHQIVLLQDGLTFG